VLIALGVVVSDVLVNNTTLSNGFIVTAVAYNRVDVEAWSMDSLASYIEDVLLS
jgi:hypothetical protein